MFNAIHLDELDPRKNRRKKEKAAILTRNCGLCIYCGAENPDTVDHIIPQIKAQHLKHYFGNQGPCCKSCNNSKSDSEWLTWFRSQPFYDENRERDIRAMLGE